MADPFDLYAGLAPGTFVAHLSDGSPLTIPISLGNLKEATFPGYRPAVFQPYIQNQIPGGVSYLSGQAIFTNNGPAGVQSPTCLFIIAVGQPNTLIAVLPVSGTDLVPLPSGDFTITMNFTCYLATAGS